MSERTVTVKLRAEVAAYLRNMKVSENATKKLKDEIEELDKAGRSLTKAGLISALAGIPGLISPAGAAMAALTGLVIGAAASFGTLAFAVNGTGDAMKAVAEGDAEKLNEALKGLSSEARLFIAEYQRVKPTLDAAASRTQDAFFHQLRGDFEMLAERYLPTLLVQMPRLASSLGEGAHELAQWAGSPVVVAKMNRQFGLAADLTGEWTRLLRAGLGAMLDLADASADFNRDFVGGLADGAETFERWVARLKSSGQLTQIFENAQRVMQRLGQAAAQLGDILFQVMANAALADGAVALLNVLGVTLDVVQALLGVFESLPPGMQSTIVTIAVFGGAALMAVGRIMALKAAIDSAKLSAMQMGPAVKGVGGVLMGPWGAAITAGITVLGVFAAKHAEAKAAAGGLRDTLDQQTGAITRATRQQVVNNLAANGAIEKAKRMGLNLEELTNAVLGGSKATQDYYKQVDAMRTAQGHSGAEMSSYITRISEVAAAVDEARTGWGDMQTAMGIAGVEIDETTGKVKVQITALKMLADELQKQADPVFALIKAQQDLRDAQSDYDAAVKEHGRTSDEARAASLALAESSVRLTAAVAETAEVFNGQLTPQMVAAFKAAGLTTKQISEIEQQFKEAAAAGKAFAGTYEVQVKVSELDQAIRKARELRNLLGSFAAAANADGEYVSGKRWGGVTLPARHGRLRDAQVFSSVSSGARYAFAEPATQGEAFVPKNGSRQRSLGIIDTAAGWYGHTLAPMGGTAGGGVSVQTIVHRHEHTITLTGREQMTGFRREIKLGGGIVQNVAGSRPA